MINEFEKALEPLRSMLAADGYLLHLESTPAEDRLTLTVEPGSGACEECLVPVDLFTTIVTGHLADRGLHPELTVVYPDCREV
jgi:hypothetical protein